LEIPGAPAADEGRTVGRDEGRPRRAAGAAKKLRILLVASAKDHGLGEHDYPLWQRRWLNLLGTADAVTVAEAKTGDAEQWKTRPGGHVLVQPGVDGGARSGPGRLLARGGGLVFLHWASTPQGRDALAQRIGFASRELA